MPQPPGHREQQTLCRRQCHSVSAARMQKAFCPIACHSTKPPTFQTKQHATDCAFSTSPFVFESALPSRLRRGRWPPCFGSVRGARVSAARRARLPRPRAPGPQPLCLSLRQNDALDSLPSALEFQSGLAGRRHSIMLTVFLCRAPSCHAGRALGFETLARSRASSMTDGRETALLTKLRIKHPATHRTRQHTRKGLGHINP